MLKLLKFPLKGSILVCASLFWGSTVTLGQDVNACYIIEKSGTQKVCFFSDEPTIFTDDNRLCLHSIVEGDVDVCWLSELDYIYTGHYDEKTPTSIQFPDNTPTEVEFYDLSGKRVSSPIQGKIYVVKATDGSNLQLRK